ncbi:hypothetical protein JN531_002305 [Flagellatimonas centrodinii]|uniref:hypothetical protein n=1 Tax=Flagellatimonas centrodinii TaxID=2806210 RepID=UPI001FF6FD63|nr:hypothetical protein [Flagellatimonas centrodinii]ULQ47127.1 hypothetical protein JN531_002305 [Flagellatimonas centrodinii]
MTEAPASSRQDPARIAVKCYGGKAALSWENDESRAGDEFRVSVQGAPAVAPQKYDWGQKIVLQLTQAECLNVLAVLTGLRPRFEARAHGTENDKSFAIEVQASGKFYGKVAQKDRGLFGVPIESADAVRVAGLICRQLVKNQPWLDANGLQNLLRGVMQATQRAQIRPSESVSAG